MIEPDPHSVNAGGRPFTSYRPGESLARGDARPPNTIGRDDGIVNGYINRGEMGVGMPRSIRRPR
jgi:hypothetical protein